MRNNGSRQPTEDASRSVLNALSILESFEGRYSRQTLSELSRRLRLPKATVYRNLAALEIMGYVCRDSETGSYSLGPQVLSLSRLYSEQNSLVKVGARHLSELADITGETTHLSILNGHQVVYVDVAPGRQAIRAVVERGDRLPAHCVASGKAILANSETSVLDDFLEVELAPLTGHTVASSADFRAEADKVRRLGYATCVGEWLDEVSAIAAPVFGHNNKVVGAIGLAGPRGRLNRERLESFSSAIIDQASNLSRDLGGGDRVLSIKSIHRQSARQ